MPYYSDNEVDKVVETLFDGEPGFACDVGANDGLLNSNTLHFEELGWTVLCVEPNPFLATEGRERRKLWVECAAGAEDADDQEFSLCHPSNKWASASCLGSSPRADGHKTEQLVLVQVRRLDRLLEEAGFTKLDFLTVDVEGWEPEVMAGFTVERWKPKVIVLEEWSNEVKINIPGYKIIEKRQHDNIYVREDS